MVYDIVWGNWRPSGAIQMYVVLTQVMNNAGMSVMI